MGSTAHGNGLVLSTQRRQREPVIGTFLPPSNPSRCFPSVSSSNGGGKGEGVDAVEDVDVEDVGVEDADVAEE